MKILVTGAAGFIGFHLVNRLLECGYEVVGLDNINSYYDVELKFGRLRESGIVDSIEDGYNIEENLPIISTKDANYKFIKLDLANKEHIDALFKKENFNAVCNLAAQAGVRYSIENPDVYIQSNIVGFLNILEGCRNYEVKNLSYASSSSVYGLNEAQPFKTTHKSEHQISLYAASKKSNELMAHTYSHLYNIKTTGLRFFTVYGPWGRPDMAPMLFSDAILNNQEIKVFNNGKMSRDFTYIDDIIEGIVKVIQNPAKANANWDAKDPEISSSSAPFKIYNIGSNRPTSLMDFIQTLEKELGIIAKKNFLPIQKGDVVSTYADVSDLIEDFGYKPTTPLEVGVKEFVKWYREFYRI